MSIGLTLSKFKKYQDSPFYRAFASYPGNLLLEHWEASKRMVWEDVQKLKETKPEEAKKYEEEILTKNTAKDWFLYMSSAWVDIFQRTN